MGGDFVIPVKYCIDYEEQSMLDGVEVVLNKYADFDFGQMHTHTFIEVCCVTEGTGWHVLNDHIYRCSPGDLFIIDVGDAHAWISEHEGAMTIYNLIFRPAFFDANLRGKSSFADMAGCFLLGGIADRDSFTSMRAHFSEAELAGLTDTYETMLDEYNRHEAGFIELIRAQATLLLINAFRKRSSAADPAHENGHRSSSLAPVFDYINVHFAEDISLNRLAALAYLSPSYFSRVFRLYTGRTVTEYIQRVRIYNARSQLQNTELPISAIAAANGYSDSKHFTRIFKRIQGVSPTEYRSRQRNK